MASKAKVGAGIQLQRGDGVSPEVFTTIPEVTSLKFGGIKVDREEVTNQDSAVQNGLIFKEYISTLADGGEITATFNYLASDTVQEALRNSQDGKVHNFKIVVRDLTQSPIVILKTFSFAAFVDSWSIPDFQVSKKMEGNTVLKVSGPITAA